MGIGVCILNLDRAAFLTHLRKVIIENTKINGAIAPEEKGSIFHNNFKTFGNQSPFQFTHFDLNIENDVMI